MGKKARKTRWRTLAIDTGNQSDSEESHTAINNKSAYYQNGAYNASYSNGNSGGGGGGGGHYHHNGYQPSSHYGGVQRSYRPSGGGRYALAASGGGVPRGRFGHHGHHYYPHSHNGHAGAAGGGAATHGHPPGRKEDDTKTTPAGGNAAAGGTNSDGKITFNEDEYTRITTPRQDVLFKKGYLSKPKAYQTQTSTGASTISTGNSTGNGTPDHQSADGTEGTDMEYESQFVFPNGFVDQNGIYYINSYEPYPLVVYNPHMCYPEYVASTRSKRLSTGSLTESTSPHNEETSQDLSHSGGETVNYSEYGNMFNVVYPGYYYNNGVPQEMEVSHGEPRKIKKRRRRKLSKPVPEGNWTTSSSDDYDESEEMVSEIENRIIQGTHRPPAADSPEDATNSEEKVDKKEDAPQESEATEDQCEKSSEEVPDDDGSRAKKVECDGDATATSSDEVKPEDAETVKVEKKALKADAKEFVPRFFHHRHHHPPPHHAQFLIPLPPSFLQHQHHHAHPHPHAHQQIHILAPPPHALPPQAQAAVIPTTIQSTSSTPTTAPPLTSGEETSHQTPEVSAKTTDDQQTPEESDKIPETVTAPHQATGEEVIPLQVAPSTPASTPTADASTLVTPVTPTVAVPKPASPRSMVGVPLVTSPLKQLPKQQIDIAKFVSKLEAAAKEQRRPPRSRRNYTRSIAADPAQDKRGPGGSTIAAIKVDTRSTSTSTYTSMPPSGTKNYAQMLSKKSTATSPMKKFTKSRSPSAPVHTSTQNHHQASSNTESSKTPQNPSGNPHTLTQPPKPGSSQWISVQSRKKRKNKNHEDVDGDWEEEAVVPEVKPQPDDGFEVYDVNKLEDVIVVHVQEPPKKTSQELSEVAEVSDKFENVVVLTRDNNIEPVQSTVSEEEVVQVTELSIVDQKAAEEEEFDKLIRTLEELEAKTPAKKKSLHKTPSKRVMITDVQVEEVLPLTITEIRDEEPPKPRKPKKKVYKDSKEVSKDAKEVSKDVKDVPNDVKDVSKDVKDISKDVRDAPDVEVEEVREIREVVSLDKMETPTSDLTESPRSDASTSEIKACTSEEVITESLPEEEAISVCTEESPEKKRKKKKKPSKKPLTLETPPNSIPTTPSTSASTGDEPSYNFLLTDSLLEEERTNLEVSEELDKIIQRGMFTSLEEKIKSLNITAVNSDDGFFKSMTTFEGTGQKLSKEDNLTTILAKTTNIFNAKRPMCQHQDAEPTTTGSFLDLASLHEDPGISRLDIDYPITNAVRDWMVRTRETTPELELLKSPRTILKEITKSPQESLATASSIKESWSLTPESSFEDEDLLECWDDLEDTTRITVPSSPAPAEVVKAEDKGKQIEASLEVYESLYGKNEDFKQIKADVEERKRNGTKPKHGGLPYHAICCSLQ